MKRLIFIISLFISVSFQGQGLISFGTIAASGSSWVDRMAISYVSINSHSTFTQTQIDTIKDRLAEVQAVFGPLGQNKTVCDFFMYFQNSNTSTNLATLPNIKTGATLLWDYGATSYSQNNLPAQTCNGHISVTSTDGFGGWTTFDIQSNTFINHLPNISMLANVAYYYVFLNTGINDNISAFVMPNSTIYFYCYSTSVSGNFSSFYLSPVLQRFNISATLASGDISTLILPNTLTRFYIYTTGVSGSTPNISTTTSTALIYQSNNTLLSTAGTTVFRKGMTVFNLQNCYLNTTQVDAFLSALDAWFVDANLMTANCTITLDGATMGIPTGGVNNVNILSLLAKATGQSKLWSFVIRT